MEQNKEILTYTMVLHSARKKLKLTLSEYCVADTVYHLSNNPNNKFNGWCYATKETIKNYIGIDLRKLYRIIKTLVRKKIIIRDEETKYLKTTSKWYENVILQRLKLRGNDKMSVSMTKCQSDSDKMSVGRVTKCQSYKDTLNKDKNKDKDDELEFSELLKKYPLFEKFYSTYPKKLQGRIVLKAFQKLSPSPSLLKVILKDIETKKKSEQWLKDSGKFIQYPASYLNQRRWEDEDKGNEPVKKPYYKGDPLYGEPYNRTIKVKGELKQFAGREDEVEWE